jgi:hypothetical protein
MMDTKTRNLTFIKSGEPTALVSLGNTVTYITPVMLMGDESIAIKYLRFYGGTNGSGTPGTSFRYFGAFLRADSLKNFQDIGRPEIYPRTFRVLDRFDTRLTRDVANRHILQEVYFPQPVQLKGGGPTYIAITSDAADSIISSPQGSQAQSFDPSWVALTGGGRIPDYIQATATVNGGLAFLAYDEAGCVRYLP